MKSFPYFDDIMEPAGLKAVQAVRTAGKDALTELVKYGEEAFGFCWKHARKDDRHFHAILFGMARHVLVYMDCLSVLVGHGCVEGCTPLLRSLLEAMLSISHIVEEKHEERAIAYRYFCIKHWIKKLRMGDNSHSDGQGVKAELVGDMFTPDILDQMPNDLGEQADAMERHLAGPLFAPVVAELERLKNLPGGKRKPEWFTLFTSATAGRVPYTRRDWAKNLKCVSLYLFAYKDMSNEAHVGDTLRWLTHGESALRPLRYPPGLHNVLSQSFVLFINSFGRLAAFYDSSLGDQFLKHAHRTLSPKFQRLIEETKRVCGSVVPDEVVDTANDLTH